MKKTIRLAALAAIAGFAMAMPAIMRAASVTNTYAYQPVDIKLVVYFAGTMATNGHDVFVTKGGSAKINNAVLIQKLGQWTGNTFSPKAQLMVKSLVTDKSYQNVEYKAVVVDGTREVDVYDYLHIGTYGYEMMLSGKANLSTGKANLNSMGTLQVQIHSHSSSDVTWALMEGCAKGETAVVKLNKEIVGYVQHWKSPESDYRAFEGDQAMFDGTVSMGHVTKVVTAVEEN